MRMGLPVTSKDDQLRTARCIFYTEYFQFEKCARVRFVGWLCRLGRNASHFLWPALCLSVEPAAHTQGRKMTPNNDTPRF
jgi:hypothetical protein